MKGVSALYAKKNLAYFCDFGKNEYNKLLR